MSINNLKAGHSVEFYGLKSATHLNGTRATVIKFVKKQWRWSVQCKFNNKLVHAKSDNLIRVNLSSCKKQFHHNKGNNSSDLSSVGGLSQI